MRIVLIGAGNLATNLGKALKASGHEIVQVYSRTMTSAARLAGTLDCPATCSTDEVVTDAEAYILAVKDMALRDFADNICRGREQGIFMHTAGSMPLDIFKGHAVRFGVFYPMQTFSKDRDVEFAEIPIFIEADSAKTLKVIRDLAESVSNRVYELHSAERSCLHLAAVFACNFVNHCYALSSEILKQHGIPFSVMLPLIDETARKVKKIAPCKAQTGPAVRYDRNVISTHLNMLDRDSMMHSVYELMSRSIHETATETAFKQIITKIK